MKVKDKTNNQWKYIGGEKKTLFISSVNKPSGTETVYPFSTIETYNEIPHPHFINTKQLYVFINEEFIIFLDAALEIRGTMRIKTKDEMIEVVR